MRLLRTSAGIVVLTLMAACGKDTPAGPTPTSVIALSGNMTFGSVTVGQAATATLTIANTGNAELTLTSVAYPAGFTGNFTSGTIAANGSQAVAVTFTPTTAQTYTGNITVTGNQASGTNTIAVSGTGIAIPTFTLSGLVTETPPTTSTVLSGVVVTVVDGANQVKTATTGSDGRYQITGVVNCGFTVSSSKAGYTTVMLPIGINGSDARLGRADRGANQFRSRPVRVGPDIPAGRYYADSGNGCHFSACARWRRARRRSSTPSSTRRRPVDRRPAVHRRRLCDRCDCGFWFTTPRRGCRRRSRPACGSSAHRSLLARIAPRTPAGCFWQRVSNFTGAIEATLARRVRDQPGVQFVTIAGTDAGFSSNVECGTWAPAPIR